MIRTVLFAVALSVSAAAPAWAEKASLAALSAYLNTIEAAEATFRQSNADGSVSTGTLYIRRPGRIRFEYDPPNDEVLVVAGGGQVAVFDGRGTGAEQFPLARTPLKLLLDRNIDLTRISMVTGHGEQDGRTIVQAQDPDHPEYGRIYLYFERDPLRLSEWLIISETGERTRVQLSPFRARPDLSTRLFNIPLIARDRS